MREIDKILDQNEKVLWEGKPDFWPFFGISCIGGVIGFFMLFFSFLELIFLNSLGLIFYLGFCFSFILPLYQFLAYKITHYAITDKRVLIQQGVIGRDFKIIDFDQITNSEVNVGLFDKLFGGRTGSILISTAGSFTSGQYGPVHTPFALRSIFEPYEVFKFFKKISHDVKTDIQYPNDYRPQTNKGYKTQYDPEEN